MAQIERSSLRILTREYAQTATITVNNTAAGLGAANLKTEDKFAVCRSLSGTVQIVLEWDTPQSVAVAHIPALTIGPSAQGRMRAWLDTDQTELVGDSGLQWLASGTVLQNWDFSQRLNDPLTARADSVNYFMDNVPTATLYLPEHVGARRVVIDIADESRTFVDMSKLVVGPYYSPRQNAAFGEVGRSVADGSVNARTFSGNLVTARGAKSRTLDFQLSWIGDADRAYVETLVSGGVSEWVFVSMLSEDADPTRAKFNEIYGKPRSPAGLQIAGWGQHRTQVQIDGF